MSERSIPTLPLPISQGGTGNPTGLLRPPAGTATAGTAPLVLLPGPLLAVPEAGAVERFDDVVYVTNAAGVRQALAKDPSWRVLDIQDDFVSGSTEAGEIGTWGWTPNGTGAPSHLDGIANHPGILSIPTGATTNQYTTISLRTGSVSYRMLATELDYFGYIINIPTITSIDVSIGFGANAIAQANLGGDSVYFSFTPGTSAFWRTVTRLAGAATTTASTVTVTAGNWYLLEAFRDTATGNWSFYINGALVTTHSATLPTAAVGPTLYVNPTSDAIREVQIDWSRLRSKVYTQRWT